MRWMLISLLLVCCSPPYAAGATLPGPVEQGMAKLVYDGANRRTLPVGK